MDDGAMKIEGGQEYSGKRVAGWLCGTEGDIIFFWGRRIMASNIAFQSRTAKQELVRPALGDGKKIHPQTPYITKGE